MCTFDEGEPGQKDAGGLKDEQDRGDTVDVVKKEVKSVGV